MNPKEHLSSRNKPSFTASKGIFRSTICGKRRTVWQSAIYKSSAIAPGYAPTHASTASTTRARQRHRREQRGRPVHDAPLRRPPLTSPKAQQTGRAAPIPHETKEQLQLPQSPINTVNNRPNTVFSCFLRTFYKKNLAVCPNSRTFAHENLTTYGLSRAFSSVG